MQPTRIRAAAARVLRRARTRVMPFDLVHGLLARDERLALPAHDLAAALRDDDQLVLLEQPSPLADLPLVVREAAAAYHEALGGAVALAVLDAGEVAGRTDETDPFLRLAAPLFQAWRDAHADSARRAELARALMGLWTLVRTIESQPRTR